MTTISRPPLRGLVPVLFACPWAGLLVGSGLAAQEPVVTEQEEPSPIEDLVAFSDLGLDDALAAAKKAGKVVMVDFFADWCVPCHKLDRTTWRHHDVVEWLQANVIAIKVDGERFFSQKQRYDVHAFPTMVFIRPDGTKIDMHVGYLDAADFLDMGNKTLFGKSTIELAKAAVDASPDDPMLHKVYADKLSRRYRFADALTEYLWCLDEGASKNPSFAGYREGFLLTDIARLGERYPAALQALTQRAQATTDELLAGKGTLADAKHVAALNRVSNRGAETYLLWNKIQESSELDDALADAMFDEVFDVLLAERRYDAIAASVGDVFGRIDGDIQRYWMNSQSMGEGVDEELAVILREAVVKGGARYYEVMLGAGKPEVAEKIVTKLLEFQESGQTFAALIEAAIRAGDVETAKALGERGMSLLDRGQHSSIKRALRKLPKDS